MGVKVVIETKDNNLKAARLKIYSEDHLLYGYIIEKDSVSEVKEIKDRIKNEEIRAEMDSFMRLFRRMERRRKTKLMLLKLRLTRRRFNPWRVGKNFVSLSTKKNHLVRFIC